MTNHDRFIRMVVLVLHVLLPNNCFIPKLIVLSGSRLARRALNFWIARRPDSPEGSKRHVITRMISASNARVTKQTPHHDARFLYPRAPSRLPCPGFHSREYPSIPPEFFPSNPMRRSLTPVQTVHACVVIPARWNGLKTVSFHYSTRSGSVWSASTLSHTHVPARRVAILRLTLVSFQDLVQVLTSIDVAATNTFTFTLHLFYIRLMDNGLI